MFKEEILENQKRQRIYSFIKANPGIHQRGLQRKLDMPLATLEYHLQYMERKKKKGFTHDIIAVRLS